MTAQETLALFASNKFGNYEPGTGSFTDIECIQAMEAYSIVKNRELLKCIAELESWKASMSKVHDEINIQQVGKEPGVKLGVSIGEKILPCIKTLKSERRNLIRLIRAMNALHEAGLTFSNEVKQQINELTI